MDLFVFAETFGLVVRFMFGLCLVFAMMGDLGGVSLIARREKE